MREKLTKVLFSAQGPRQTLLPVVGQWQGLFTFELSTLRILELVRPRAEAHHISSELAINSLVGCPSDLILILDFTLCPLHVRFATWNILLQTVDFSFGSALDEIDWRPTSTTRHSVSQQYPHGSCFDGQSTYKSLT